MGLPPSTTLGNALVHKRRVMEKLLPFGKISIIIVADQQADLAYHYCGLKQNEKNERDLPEIPNLIEFIKSKNRFKLLIINNICCKGFEVGGF